MQQLAGGHPLAGHPMQYDEYLKAYSVAMLPGKERLNVSYGGKIIMPPSSLASLTQLELESPWIFQLRNPSNAAASTHAGVLEFIAEEGVVHLPYWMMKTLRLNEGDPIRLTGTTLPKGKFVKLQAQTVDFLEVSDPKAVLEQALRNFITLTQGDIIEISYNAITFEFLIMETQPAGAGINLLDTDLEVDFAAPKGYVEPKRPEPAPLPTMAQKLNIDLDSSPGSSRPASSLGGAFAGAGVGHTVSKDGQNWEAFKGKGETLAGRRTKGKGVSVRKIEDQQLDSKVIRTDKRLIVSNDTLEENVRVPGALKLPPGRLFFGYKYVPYKPPSTEPSDAASGSGADPSTGTTTGAFSGQGSSLAGPSRRGVSSQPRSGPGSSVKKEEPVASESAVHNWGTGSSLGQSSRAGAGGAGPSRSTAASASASSSNRRNTKPPPKRERSPTPDYGVDTDEDVIEIDSD